MRSELAASASLAVDPRDWTPSVNWAWSGVVCTVPVPVTVIPPEGSEAPPARSGRPTPARATTPRPAATSAAIRIAFMTAPFEGSNKYAAEGRSGHCGARSRQGPREPRPRLARREPARTHPAPHEEHRDRCFPGQSGANRAEALHCPAIGQPDDEHARAITRLQELFDARSGE